MGTNLINTLVIGIDLYDYMSYKYEQVTIPVFDRYTGKKVGVESSDKISLRTHKEFPLTINYSSVSVYGVYGFEFYNELRKKARGFDLCVFRTRNGALYGREHLLLGREVVQSIDNGGDRSCTIEQLNQVHAEVKEIFIKHKFPEPKIYINVEVNS